MNEIKARLKLTRVIMEAIRQGLTLGGIKKISGSKSRENRPAIYLIKLKYPSNRFSAPGKRVFVSS